MKKGSLSFVILAMSLLSLPLFSQTESQTEKDSTLLGLPGDNLDLYAVLDLFQKSKTIEDFEKSLNLEKTGINNLDLDLDNKVDFIKVVTKKDGDDFTFVLQVAVNEKETQDVAVILVSKDKDKKVSMQIVGDPDLYGKDYIVEPKTSATPAVTANPGYVGPEPVTVTVPATTTVVVVESTPIVQYVYSPVYVPYVPPYYYGFYPPYFAAFTVMAVGIYHHNNYYHHGGYSHGNTVVVHNTNNYNNYNNSRNTSNTVNHNNANGNYNRNNASTRPSSGASASTRPSASPSTRPSTGASASTRPSTGASASTRPSTGASASPSTRQSSGSSASTRPSSSNYSSQQRSSSTGASRSRSSGGYSGGGYSGGGSRGGGGGRRR
jgi:uncharacterized membrane protein YgcG